MNDNRHSFRQTLTCMSHHTIQGLFWPVRPIFRISHRLTIASLPFSISVIKGSHPLELLPLGLQSRDLCRVQPTSRGRMGLDQFDLYWTGSVLYSTEPLSANFCLRVLYLRQEICDGTALQLHNTLLYSNTIVLCSSVTVPHCTA
jgi:hypothetical protein